MENTPPVNFIDKAPYKYKIMSDNIPIEEIKSHALLDNMQKKSLIIDFVNKHALGSPSGIKVILAYTTKTSLWSSAKLKSHQYVIR